MFLDDIASDSAAYESQVKLIGDSSGDPTTCEAQLILLATSGKTQVLVSLNECSSRHQVTLTTSESQ